jgi:hypothetical protein
LATFGGRGLKPTTQLQQVPSLRKRGSIRRGADKSLAFPIFLFAAQSTELFFDGLKFLEQRSHKCVCVCVCVCGAQGEYVE